MCWILCRPGRTVWETLYRIVQYFISKNGERTWRHRSSPMHSRQPSWQPIQPCLCTYMLTLCSCVGSGRRRKKKKTQALHLSTPTDVVYVHTLHKSISPWGRSAGLILPGVVQETKLASQSQKGGFACRKLPGCCTPSLFVGSTAEQSGGFNLDIDNPQQRAMAGMDGQVRSHP